MMSSPRIAGAVAALCLVQFVDVLGVTVVVTALPDMLRDVGADVSAGGYVATGYAMFFGGLLMFGARLGDRVGHRRAIQLSLLVFAIGSVVGATASSLAVLTAARCVQGAAAACAVPSALRLLTTVAPDGPQRARAVAAWSAAGAAAGASGFVVGGLVTEFTTWRVIFWGYLPVAALLSYAIRRAVPADGSGDPGRSLNLLASATLTLAVMAVVAGATEIADRQTRAIGAGLLAAAVVLGGCLIRIDRRSPAPLLPRSVVRLATVRRGAIGSFLNTATTSSVATLITLYLQDAQGRSPLAAAGSLLPFSFAVIAGAALAAPAMQRFRRERVSAAGLAAIAAADAALLVVHSTVVGVSLVMIAAGIGLGLSSVAATSLGTDVDEFSRATASGLINTAAQVGTAIGVAAILVIATVTTGSPGRHAPTTAWLTAALIALAGAGSFAALRRVRISL
jgi:MFS family permease